MPKCPTCGEDAAQLKLIMYNIDRNTDFHLNNERPLRDRNSLLEIERAAMIAYVAGYGTIDWRDFVRAEAVRRFKEENMDGELRLPIIGLDHAESL